MGYSGVFVFGDSLVDGGNALKLAETYDYFPFTSLPDGAPTSEKGYYLGNFTNGRTFADLISNKYVGLPTHSVFPFGYDDPFLGISFGFISDPKGHNLNFAYGGAQIRQGGEAVPDMDDQTDAYRDAVDGHADPNALHLFVFGANDVHDLVPKDGEWTDLAHAQEILQRAANEYIEEIRQTIDIGARHILATGVPDIGIQPYYNGTADEAARRAVATQYAQLLEDMIEARLYKLQIPGVEFHFVPFGELATSVLGTMVDLYGPSEIYPLNLSNEVFFDKIHPTAQVHALAAAQLIDLLDGPAGERMPLTAPDYSANGTIAVRGEIDTVTVSLAANTNYTFELLGICTLGGNYLTLADPMLRVYRPDGTLLGANDDGGIGLDSSFTFTSGAAGDYIIQLSGVGSMTGAYLFQAAGQANGNDLYSVSHASALILESVGGGFDTVKANVSFTLNPGSEIEVLRTSNDKGSANLNLTGNEFGQTIIGNSGNNILEGRAGADVLTGGGGKDVFVLSNDALSAPGHVDRITDYGSSDVVDIRQVLNVASGTNITAGGFVRVTTSGLIQVDVDGGGNNWVTISQINNGGAVTVRYLSGGLSADLAVSRVQASSMAVAGAVAAAGMASVSLVADRAEAGGDLQGVGIAMADRGDLHLPHKIAASIGLAIDSSEDRSPDHEIHSRSPLNPDEHGHSLAGDLEAANGDLARANMVVERVEAVDPAPAAPLALALPAMAVAMPSAEMLQSAPAGNPTTGAEGPDSIVGQVLAVALEDAGGKDAVVDTLLASLPSNPIAVAGEAFAGALAQPLGDNPAMPAAHAMPAIEAAALHPDAVQHV